MPGVGINPKNIQFIKEKTNAHVFHASARVKIASKMIFRNQNANMGSITDEYSIDQTSPELVKQIILALNLAS